MHLIGITGGVGAGKSTVLDYLEKKYQAMIIKADDIGRDLMEPKAPCYHQVISLFGLDIIGDDRRIDREKLARMVYESPKLLSKLNEIIHPQVKAKILDLIKAAESENIDFVFIEAALLIEDGYHLICKELWYIYASMETRIQRLMTSRNYSRQKCLKIMENQNTEEIFRKYCVFEINNDTSIDDMQKQIDQRMKTYEIV